ERILSSLYERLASPWRRTSLTGQLTETALPVRNNAWFRSEPVLDFRAQRRAMAWGVRCAGMNGDEQRSRLRRRRRRGGSRRRRPRAGAGARGGPRAAARGEPEGQSEARG